MQASKTLLLLLMHGSLCGLVPVSVPVPLNHICWEAGQWHGLTGHGQQEHRPASACHWACTVVHWGTARGVKKGGGLVRVVKAWPPG